MAIPRFAKLEYILEKGTELDATEFWLFPGIHSEKEKFSPNQLSRMQLMLTSAMKQCGHLDLPSIHFKPSLLEWEPMAGSLFFGDTHPQAPYLWHAKEDKQPFILFIGPEKGFEGREEKHLKEVLKAKGVKLHPNILRTETAAITGLSLLQALIHN